MDDYNRGGHTKNSLKVYTKSGISAAYPHPVKGCGFAARRLWSIDIMQNGDDFWLIDMALAQNSALIECVPEKLRKITEEKWIPDFKNI